MIGRMSAKKDKKTESKGPVAVNKKAYHNFELVEKIEAGLSLVGSEVKSLRAHTADLSGSYARIVNGECFLFGAAIAQYEQAGERNHEPLRKKKLLLHRREILRIRTKLEQRGFTLVPLRIYFSSRGLAKVELALARGKRQYDKRRSITERQQKKDIDRQVKRYRKRN
jgi:SsrA-binding protein